MSAESFQIGNSFLCLNVRLSTESCVILRHEGRFRDDYSIRETASILSQELVLSFGEIMQAMSAQGLSLDYFGIADQLPSDEAIRGLSLLLRFIPNHP